MKTLNENSTITARIAIEQQEIIKVGIIPNTYIQRISNSPRYTGTSDKKKKQGKKKEKEKKKAFSEAKLECACNNSCTSVRKA